MEMSKASLAQQQTSRGYAEAVAVVLRLTRCSATDPTSAIFNIVRDLAAASPPGSRLPYSDILPRVLARVRPWCLVLLTPAQGYTEPQLREALASYQAMDVWLVDNERAVRFKRK
jgi:hypothetical protein